MRIVKLLIMCLCLFGLASCNIGGDENGNSEGGSAVENTVDLTLFKDCKELRFSSYFGGADLGLVHYLKQVAPYDDSYKIKTNKYTTCKFYDKDGYILATVEPNKALTIELAANDIVYTVAITDAEGHNIEYEVELVEHKSLLPYDPINLVDGDALLKEDKSSVDPLKPAQLSYIKREGGLYINCNNPEKLTDSCLNVALTRNDVSNQEVFFTFEHNNMITGSFYYGYQVINKGSEDVYITVKNIGFQLDGAGCWLGEKEWTDFYNTEFRVKNLANYTEGQLKNFEAYFGFCDTYENPNYQPITYRIPAGKHIYVMGGTTKDSYNKINVFQTANKKVSGGCSNGAVLFEVVGDNVEAAFYAYKNPENVQIDNQTHQGYVAMQNGHEYGRQLIGYDNCHGVVDANLTWEFSDLTEAQYLPVTYTNYYMDGVKGSGNTPYGKIDSTAHVQNGREWTTHINPQNNNKAIGTDMTKYYTIDSEGNEICIDSDHYDGLGYTANIGNWMIDYLENYTFVNHGSKDRTVRVSFKNNGSVCVLVRDASGKYIDGTAQFTVCVPASSYGSAINDAFEYIVVVPAGSVVQFSVEYNLLANSSGNIVHYAELE